MVSATPLVSKYTTGIHPAGKRVKLSKTERNQQKLDWRSIKMEMKRSQQEKLIKACFVSTGGFW